THAPPARRSADRRHNAGWRLLGIELRRQRSAERLTLRFECRDLLLQRVRLIEFERRHRELTTRLQPDNLLLDCGQPGALFGRQTHRAHLPLSDLKPRRTKLKLRGSAVLTFDALGRRHRVLGGAAMNRAAHGLAASAFVLALAAVPAIAQKSGGILRL